MFVKQKQVTITTNSDGDATGYVSAMNGRILSIVYQKDDYASGIDIVVTNDNTGEAILTKANMNASVGFVPGHPVNAVADGSAITNAWSHLLLVDERVKIVVDEGGDAKSGTFFVNVG